MKPIREKFKFAGMWLLFAAFMILFVVWNLWGILNFGWFLEHSPY